MRRTLPSYWNGLGGMGVKHAAPPPESTWRAMNRLHDVSGFAQFTTPTVSTVIPTKFSANVSGAPELRLKLTKAFMETVSEDSRSVTLNWYSRTFTLSC